MPPATLFLTVCDRRVRPVNQASSFDRAAGPKSKKLHYNTHSFLWLYAKSSRPGVTSSEYITILRGFPCRTESKNVLNSGHSWQHTHRSAAGCTNGGLMQPPPPFNRRGLLWISLPNGVIRLAKALRSRCMVLRLAASTMPCFSGLCIHGQVPVG